MAAVRNMNEAEAAQAAASKEVAVDVLRFIGFKKEWLSHYEVKRTFGCSTLGHRPASPCASSST